MWSPAHRLRYNRRFLAGHCVARGEFEAADIFDDGIGERPAAVPRINRKICAQIEQIAHLGTAYRDINGFLVRCCPARNVLAL